MKTKLVSIREFGLLIKSGNQSSLSLSSIEESAFDWLLANGQAIDSNGRDLIRLKRLSNKTAIQVINYVGVIQTPCGTRIEILPKISSEDNLDALRRCLLKMLTQVIDLPFEEREASSLKTISKPIYESLISQYLLLLSKLVRKGLKSDYIRKTNFAPFIKGSIQLAKQLREPGHTKHLTHIVYDQYSLGRPENKLIKSSLLRLSITAKDPKNLKKIKELLALMEPISQSKNITNDFTKWVNNRNLAGYRHLKTWCELILLNKSPITLAGKISGISMLFPMEILFERYVGKRVSEYLSPHLYNCQMQANSEFLAVYEERKVYNLKPDLLIKQDSNNLAIMDMKWKQIAPSKYSAGANQSDIYQMFAYGHKYLKNTGKLFLIYPRTDDFRLPSNRFEFSTSLSLYLVPYDLRNDIDTLKFIEKNISP